MMSKVSRVSAKNDDTCISWLYKMKLKMMTPMISEKADSYTTNSLCLAFNPLLEGMAMAELMMLKGKALIKQAVNEKPVSRVNT